MRLDEATAVLRPRGAWEAVDLGCALARRHWGKLIAGWLTVALPLWALVFVLLRNHPGWAGLALWWTKPVLTRHPVFFMSRALFGAPPTIRSFWREWKTALLQGLIGDLTFRRLSFQRSFRLPVGMLEGQRGAAASARLNVLGSHGGSSAATLSYASLKLEFVITAALMFWLEGFLSEGLLDWVKGDPSLIAMHLIPDWYLWTSNAFYCLAIAVIEPVYAAAGFTLYINSRSHLEGWDIEVIFRRLSQRLSPLATTLTLALLLCLGMSSPARAEESPASEPAKIVQEILKEPEFEIEMRKVPKPKTEEKRQEAPENQAPSTGGGGDMRWLGFVFIGLLVVVIAWLIWRNRGSLRRGPASQNPGRQGPRVVMGMDLAPESLPEDIPQTAWREYQAGNFTDALRLLYRASLAWLVDRAALPVHGSDTEGDCLRHTRTLNDPGRRSYFEQLTAAWISCAYAAQPPGSSLMQQLCGQWPFSLQPQRRAPVLSGPAVRLLALGTLLFQGCSGQTGKPQEMEEKPVGYKGAARFDPWLAAEKFLTRMGTTATMQPVIGEMPDPSHALFIPGESITSSGAARQLLQWAVTGGHLIVACSGTDRFYNDFGGGEIPEPGNYDPILKALGVTLSEEPADLAVSVTTDEGTSLSMEREHLPGLNVTSQSPDFLCGDQNNAAVASFRHGYGRITLLATAQPFRNRWLSEGDNAEILLKVMQLEPVVSVIFIASSRVNLWDMLRTHAWMPLIAVLLLIALWLWRHLPRFGPALPADLSSLRHFGSQLDEAGRFLAERTPAGTLLGAARRALLQAAARRGLYATQEDFALQLAQRSGLPENEIRSALENGNDSPAAAAVLQKLLHTFSATL